jgi:hypothetical protein
MDLAPFTLTITFLGLVTFVPIEKDGHLETMWVLLQNAENGNGPCAAVDPKDLRPDHHAFLRYPARNLAGASLAGFGNEQMVLTPLSAVDLRIEEEPGEHPTPDLCSAGLEEGRLRRYQTRKRSGWMLFEAPKNDCELRDFSWVPDLQHFASPLAAVCDTCLQEPVTEDFPLSRIAARLKLTQGTLRVDSLEKIEGGGVAMYRFANGSSTDQQGLADQVSLRLEGLTQPVTLAFSNLRKPSEAQKRITLTPAAHEKEVRITILNHVPMGVLDPEHDHQGGSSSRLLEDFRLYYKLSARINPDDGTGCTDYVLPVPERIKSDRNRPICPKAQMSPPVSPVVPGKKP